MKTLVLMTLGAAALYGVAKHYNINSLKDLKAFCMPEKTKS
jgi:hypothetical protein